MKKPKCPAHHLQLLLAITLSIIITSCKGQDPNTPRNTIQQTEPATTNSISDNKKTNNDEAETPFQYPDFDNQISDVVRTVFQDSKENLWFGTQSGAFKYNGKSLTHLADIKCEAGRGVTIKEITEGKDGRIWFGHTDGISVVDGDSVTNYYERDGLINNDVWCITTDKNNHIWIGTIEGVCKFDGKDFTNFELPEGKVNTTLGVSSTKMVHDIMEDSQGRMWFSTNGGVYIQSKNKLINLSEKDGLHSSFVNKVIETKQGHFLISTPKGLFQYKEDTLLNISNDFFEESKGVGSLIEDSKGIIWFNCSRSIYSLNGQEFKEHRIADGNYGPLTFQIYEDQLERLWFVGYGGAFRYENGVFINVGKDGPF